MDFDRFFATKNFERCTIQESIASYIHLLVITTFEEYDFDSEFGCRVWDFEFEHHQSTRIWAEQLSRNVEETLSRYENRLTAVEVKTLVTQVEFEHKEEFSVAKRLKKKLNIVLNGRLTATNETFRFEDNILLSPFSTD